MIDEVLREVSKIVSPVYLVGGAVRDYIMEREVDDFDFTTPLTPDEVEEAIKTNNPGRTIWAAGKKFGTLGTKLYLPEADTYVKVEITTFRIEDYEHSSRKPNVVFTTSLHEDLSRRDFSMNAMCIRLKKGRFVIIDPFGGISDIENGIIRAVGNPKQRFKEDPVRMLRAARFASTLGFTVEESTMKKMCDCAPRILMPSKERWMIEMDKLLMGDHVEVGLNILAETRLLNYMIPELAMQVDYDQMTPHHDFTLWEHTVKVVAACPKDLNLRWAALLHDVGKPYVAIMKKTGDQKNYMMHEEVGREMCLKIGHYLKWKNDQIKEVSSLINGHLAEDSVLKPYDSGAQKRVA